HRYHAPLAISIDRIYCNRLILSFESLIDLMPPATLNPTVFLQNEAIDLSLPLIPLWFLLTHRSEHYIQHDEDIKPLLIHQSQLQQLLLFYSLSFLCSSRLEFIE